MSGVGDGADDPNTAESATAASAVVDSRIVESPAAAAAGAPLRYESSIAGALQPGERVVWEGRPVEAPPQSYWWGALVALLIVPLAIAILVALATDSATASLVGGAVSVVPFGFIVAYMIWSDIRQRRTRADGFYRVTDRRIQRISNRPGGEAAEVTLEEFGRVYVDRGPLRDDQRVTFDGVAFDALAEPAEVERVVLELWSRSGRRAKIRRTPPPSRSTARMQPPSPPPPAVASDPPARPAPPAPPALPDGITLVSDEQLLWIGRPKVWPTLNGVWLVDRLKMLAWLMIPVAILLYNFLRVPDWLQHNWIFVGIASLWLVAAMWGMTVEPLVSARKRRRTTYLLTSIRAITHVAGKRSQTTSTLLDMSTSVTLTQRGDETGDVWISVGATFERVRDAHLVQQIAIEAVRRAGTPMPLPPMTPATPEQQPRAEK